MTTPDQPRRDYMSVAQAIEYLACSRFQFNSNIRPHLTEFRSGERWLRFDRVELDAYLGNSEEMFTRRKVRDALEHAWETRWQESKGAKKKESLKNLVAAEIGDLRLSTLDYNDIEAWVQDMRDADRAVATIKLRLSCLSMALKVAARKGWTKEIPPFPEVGSPNKRFRYLLDEPDEEQLLLDACMKMRDRVGKTGSDKRRAERRDRITGEMMQHAIIFMVETGCRLGELLKVRQKDLKAHKVIFTDRKGGDTHGVPLTPRASQAIDALLASRYWMSRVRGANRATVRARSAQNWMTHRFAEVRSAAATKRPQLRDVSLHTLRHTCATRLVQAGVPIYDVSRFLGHSSIVVTERYTHLAPTNLDRAVKALENRALPNKVLKLRD